MQSENTSTSSSHRSEQLSCREGPQPLKAREGNATGGKGGFHFSDSRLKLESRVQSVPGLSHYHKYPKLSDLSPKHPLNSRRIYFIDSCILFPWTPKLPIQFDIFWTPINIFSNHFMFWLALGFSNVSIYVLDKWIYECMKLCFKKWSCFLMEREEKSFSLNKTTSCFFSNKDPAFTPLHLTKWHIEPLFKIKSALWGCNLHKVKFTNFKSKIKWVLANVYNYCNHHYNYDQESCHHPKVFSCSLQSILSPYSLAPSKPLSTVLSFLEPHINWII